MANLNKYTTALRQTIFVVMTKAKIVKGYNDSQTTIPNNLVKFEEWYKYYRALLEMMSSIAIYKCCFVYFEIDITNLTHGMWEIIDTNTLMEPFAGMFIKY